MYIDGKAEEALGTFSQQEGTFVYCTPPYSTWDGIEAAACRTRHAGVRANSGSTRPVARGDSRSSRCDRILQIPQLCAGSDRIEWPRRWVAVCAWPVVVRIEVRCSGTYRYMIELSCSSTCRAFSFAWRIGISSPGDEATGDREVIGRLAIKRGIPSLPGRDTQPFVCLARRRCSVTPEETFRAIKRPTV